MTKSGVGRSWAWHSRPPSMVWRMVRAVMTLTPGTVIRPRRAVAANHLLLPWSDLDSARVTPPACPANRERIVRLQLR